MKRKSLLLGAVLGTLTSLPVIGLMYLGEQLAGLPFVPFDIFDWVARVLPGGLIAFVVQIMVSIITALQLGDTSTVAKLGEQEALRVSMSPDPTEEAPQPRPYDRETAHEIVRNGDGRKPIHLALDRGFNGVPDLLTAGVLLSSSTSTSSSS